MTAANQIRSRLRAEAGFLRRRRLVMLLCGALLIMTAPLLLLGLFDLLLPFREVYAFRASAALAAAGGLFLFWRALTLRSRLPDVKRVALLAEAECPELMDSLICAVELMDDPAAERSGLKDALLQDVHRKLARHDLHGLIRARELPGITVLGLGALTVGALIGVFCLPLTTKARDYLADTIRGESTGLIVTPGNREVAAGDDLVIDAQIRRGNRDAAQVIIEQAGEVRTYDMYSRGGGRHSFEMYGVDQPFTYHVQTPTLRSPTFRITTFRKPAVTGAQLTVTPPAYTGRKEQSYPEFRNLIVPEGGTVRFVLETNLPVTAKLVTETESLQLTADTAGTQHDLELQPTGNLEYHVELADRSAHTVRGSGTYRIEILEDLPPVVRVVNPEKESSVHDKDEEVPVIARITDDYGIRGAVLLLNLNGGGWKRLPMMEPDDRVRVLEKEAATVVELDGIVDYGDVLSYYVEATDNAAPTGKAGRSEIRFLEIRPPKFPPREMEGKGGKGEELTVADLIIEQKRLIKQTFALDFTTDADRRRDRLDDLTKAAGDLYTATRQRFTKIKDAAKAKGLSLGKFEKFFDNTVRDMDRAHDLLTKELSRESIDYQQAVLSHLIKIEIELQKNAVKAKSSEPSDSRQQNTADNQANEQKKQQEKLAKLNESLRRLDDLAQRQQNLNQRFGRGARDGTRQAERDYLAGKQQDLEKTTEEIDRELRNTVPEAYEASRELSKAQDQMREARKRVDADQLANAERRGKQAKGFLERSRKLLEDLRRSLAGNQLAEAKEKLEQLRRKQAELRKQTQARAAKGKNATPREQARGMAGKQGEILEDYQKLLDELDRIGEQLEQSSPRAAEELAKGLRDSRENRAGANMKRARNALKYRQLKRAGDYQKNAEDALKKLEERLARAQKQGPQLSPEELSRMLGKMLENHRQLDDAAKGERSEAQRQQLREKIARELKEMAGRLDDAKMKALAREADKLGRSGKSGTLDPEMKSLVGKAAAIIERRLLEATIRRKLKFSRLSGRQPPDEYRKLVQEYFKKLSEMEAE